MPVFIYKAKDSVGNTVKDRITASKENNGDSQNQ